MIKRILLIFPIMFFIACTQLIDEEEPFTNAYTGDDGCLVCHTNEARLKALAPANEGDEGPGGG